MALGAPGRWHGRRRHRVPPQGRKRGECRGARGCERHPRTFCGPGRRGRSRRAPDRRSRHRRRRGASPSRWPHRLHRGARLPGRGTHDAHRSGRCRVARTTRRRLARRRHGAASAGVLADRRSPGRNGRASRSPRAGPRHPRQHRCLVGGSARDVRRRSLPISPPRALARRAPREPGGGAIACCRWPRPRGCRAPRGACRRGSGDRGGRRGCPRDGAAGYRPGCARHHRRRRRVRRGHPAGAPTWGRPRSGTCRRSPMCGAHPRRPGASVGAVVR